MAPTRVLRAFRYALYFDGVDDHARTTRTVSLSTPLTIAVWFNHVDRYNILTLIANSTSGYGNLGFRFFVNTFLTQDRSLLIESGTGTAGSGLLSPHDTVRPHTWNHGVAVVNGGNSSLWLNAQVMGAGSLYDFTKTHYIYVATMQYGFYFQGYIAQVLVYSRALSDSEIRFNYINPYNPVRNGLILWLQADPQYIKDIDGDGLLEWLDLSGFNNHCKIYGARLVELTRTPARALPVVRALPTVR